MSADDKIEVKITGDASEATSAIKSLAAEVKNSVGEIKESLGKINESFELITKGFAAVTAAMAGGKVFKEFVNDALGATKEATALGKQLGISATEASYLSVALNEAHVSIDAVRTGTMKITQNMMQGGEAIKALGVSTKDANGHFRNTDDVMQDVNAKLREFAEGSDRNVEGMKIYGRQWSEVSGMVSKFKGVTDEAREKADALNLTISQESVNAMRAYQDSQTEVKDVMEGVNKTVGEALLPRLTHLGEWFASVGPSAVEATRSVMVGYLTIQDSITDSAKAMWGVLVDAAEAIGAAIKDTFGEGSEPITGMELFQNVIKLIQVAFVGLKIGIQEGSEIISASIRVLITWLEAFGNAAKAAFAFDGKGVASAFKSATDESERILQNSMNKMVEIATKGREQIDAAIMTDIGKKGASTPSAKPKDGKAGTEKPSGSDTGSSAEKSQMMAFEAALAEKKVLYQKDNDLRQMSKQQELDYWQSIAGTVAEGSKDAIAIKKKVAETELDILKQAKAQRDGLTRQQIDENEKAALSEIQTKVATAEKEKALGEMTNAQLIALKQQYEQQRYQVESSAAADRLALTKGSTDDPVAVAKLEDQKMEIYRKHVAERGKLDTQAMLEQNKGIIEMNKTMEKSMATLMTKAITDWKHFGATLKSVFKGIFDVFMQEMIVKPLAEMAMRIVKETALYKALSAFKLSSLTTDTAAEETAATASVATNATEAQSLAGLAAVGAMASVAEIPIVGWAMAPEVGAAVYGVAEGFAATAAASGGFDIPTGVNPVTQLHQEEMVLPANIANPLRDSLANGGASASGDVHLHVHTQSTNDFKRFLEQNSQVMAPALRKMARNFTPARA
jgi:hypothetical protein